ncbi:small multi-drug export protein [Thiorhodococcus minor]|uniref:Small multi-drug export protein n=2 Tax=Thiorhodococcus minor TaxID=57489 RepID=A0A6M0JZQ2_9GAMM|nr:small multi-drug export protein [Thiorhodococcus minor]
MPPIWRSLLRTPEGMVLLAGIGLTLISLTALLIGALWSPDLSRRLLAVAATNLVFGRVAAMSFGFALGLNHVAVILPNLLMETILVLVLYPLFVFSWRQLVEVQGLHRYLGSVRTAAERNQDSVRRYGLAGLFIFVWSPIWMTGPVVGCAIGFIIGLPMHLNLGAVLAGTYLAIVVWGFGVRELLERVADLSALGGVVVIAAVIFLAGVGLLAHRRRHRKHRG